MDNGIFAHGNDSQCARVIEHFAHKDTVLSFLNEAGDLWYVEANYGFKTAKTEAVPRKYF